MTAHPPPAQRVYSASSPEDRGPVILFPIYAIAVWVFVAARRRSFLGIAIAAVSAFPVLVLSHICIQYIPLKPGEPRPEWLYLISGSYAVVVAVVGMSIALAGRGRLRTDCHHCGYDLRGVDAPLCPECGTARRCDACHAPLTLAARGRCARCYLPIPKPADVPPVRAHPFHTRTSAARRASFRRSVRALTTPRR